MKTNNFVVEPGADGSGTTMCARAAHIDKENSPRHKIDSI